MPVLYFRTAHLELAICGLLIRLFFAASPPAAETDFIVWTSGSAGSGGGISATVTSTVTQGSLTASSLNASDASFVADFAASYSVLRYRAEVVPASISSTLAFSQPLPGGAKLLAIDLDFEGEAFTLSSGGAPLALLEQRETTDGASSDFPTYDSGTGTLSHSAGSTNVFEASVFDVSGLSTIDVDFVNGLGSAGLIAIALPVPTPVPALGPVGGLTLTLCLIGVALIVTARRRSPERFCVRSGTVSRRNTKRMVGRLQHLRQWRSQVLSPGSENQL